MGTLYIGGGNLIVGVFYIGEGDRNFSIYLVLVKRIRRRICRGLI